MTQAVAAFVWAVGLIAWCAIRLPYQRRARRQRVVDARLGLAERIVLPLAGVGLSVVPIIYLATGFPAFADYRFLSSIGWAGSLIQLGFIGLFYASHRQLGRNWSVTLEIRDEHRLVTNGLYRYVRHPMYLSFWLWGLAQLLLLPNWIAGSAGVVGVAILYFSRIRTEEALMRKTFGNSYDAYAARTGRVLPRLF